MRLDLSNRDFWAGLMLVAIGLAGGWIAFGYPMGTVLRMGSGYFPTVLSGLLVAFGIALMLRALRSSERIEGGWSLRALIILPIAFLLFGVLLDRAGFVPAMLTLIVGSALAGSEFRVLEVFGLAILLTGMSIVIFIWGLGLPYQLVVMPH